MASPSGSLSTDDVLKLLKGAGIVVLAALLTWGAETLIPALSDAGGWVTLILVPALSIVINAVRKWLNDTRPTIQEVERLRRKTRMAA